MKTTKAATTTDPRHGAHGIAPDRAARATRLVGVAVFLVATLPALAAHAEHAGRAAEPSAGDPARTTVGRTSPAKGVPCRNAVLTVSRGAVFLDGQSVHPEGDKVRILVHPIWRRDRCAVAWIERTADQEIRLVVVFPAQPGPASVLPWRLPPVERGDRLFWAANNRVVVGPQLLAPRAVASWSETTTPG